MLFTRTVFIRTGIATERKSDHRANVAFKEYGFQRGNTVSLLWENVSLFLMSCRIISSIFFIFFYEFTDISRNLLSVSLRAFCSCLDCFVATLLAMTPEGFSTLSTAYGRVFAGVNHIESLTKIFVAGTRMLVFYFVSFWLYLPLIMKVWWIRWGFQF